MNRLAIVNTTPELIELGDNRFKKQILRFGKWMHSNAKNGELVISKSDVEQMVDNFKGKIIENIPIYRGHQTQKDVEMNPDLLAGEVEDLIVTDDGLEAIMNLRDDVIPHLGETYKNVSAAIDEEYQDHETGDLAGKVIRHVALVIEPYIKKLNPEFVALSDELQKEVLEFNLVEDKMPKKKKIELDDAKPEVLETPGIVEPKVEIESTPEVEVKKEEPKESEQIEPVVQVAPAIDDNKERENEDEDEKREEKIEGSEQEAKTVDVSEIEKLSKELIEAKKQIEHARERENDNLIKIWLSEGRIVPVQVETAKSILNSQSTVLLSDSEASIADAFKSFLAASPKVVDFSEKGVQITTDQSGLTEDEKATFAFMKTKPEEIEKYLERKRKGLI